MRYLLTTVILCMSTFIMAQSAYPQGLKAGDKAPMFTATDNNGKTFSLEATLKKGDDCIDVLQRTMVPLL